MCPNNTDRLIDWSDGLQMPLQLPIRTFCDNSAAVTTITTPGMTQRNRYYTRWAMFGREHYLDRKTKPEWLETIYNIADIFTKPLDKTTFLKFRDALLNIPSSRVTNKLATILGIY